MLKNPRNITRPNCALDRGTILCLYVLGFQRQIFKQVKTSSERSKEMKEQKKNKGSVLVAESTYNSQTAQFGLVPKIAINNAGTYANKLPIRCSKSSTKYEKIQFCMQYIANHKTILCMKYAFQKMRDISSEKFSEIEINIVMLFETNSFLRFT